MVAEKTVRDECVGRKLKGNVRFVGRNGKVYEIELTYAGYM